jgi:hypothetical protein
MVVSQRKPKAATPAKAAKKSGKGAATPASKRASGRPKQNVRYHSEEDEEEVRES